MSPTSATQAQPQVHRWTQAEFHQLVDQGWFLDQRVELIGGELLEMPGPGNLHCISNECVATALRGVFGRGFWVRVQMPLDCGTYSEPIPDVAVVSGEPRTHTDHPTAALLVVEVSDSTLTFDQTQKASLYAAQGMTDYWIVNLVDRRLEVHRDSVPDPAEPFGHRYQNVTHLLPTDTVTPLAAPQASLAVADLLP
jgi:Uma2 family endonuclease